MQCKASSMIMLVGTLLACVLPMSPNTTSRYGQLSSTSSK